jgi:hypothetical protein
MGDELSDPKDDSWIGSDDESQGDLQHNPKGGGENDDVNGNVLTQDNAADGSDGATDLDMESDNDHYETDSQASETRDHTLIGLDTAEL